MTLSSLKEILAKNLKIAYRLPLLVGALFILLAVMIFPSAALSPTEASRPVEMIISFIGVVFMSAVFLPEQDASVRASVYCRRVGQFAVRLMRAIISSVFTTLFVSAFCLYLRANECRISGYMIWGGIASALFMGGITFFTVGVSDNTISGILAAVIYYLLNYGLGKKLGVFYLFGMSRGTFAGKTWLFVFTVVLMAAAFGTGRIRNER